MKRRMYCVLYFMLIMNVSFSQSMRETIGEQFDKIASLPMRDKQFTITAFLGNHIYVLQQAKDSLLAFSYTTTRGGAVNGVCSIVVNDDSLFLKAVQTLFSEVQQNHKAYSKKDLADGNFFLAFNDKNKLQLFSRKDASPEQQRKINYILGRLNGYAFIPLKGHGRRVNALNINNFNEFIKQLK